MPTNYERIKNIRNIEEMAEEITEFITCTFEGVKIPLHEEGIASLKDGILLYLSLESEDNQ